MGRDVILKRLATALARQDWVAVALEFAIVILGVVIGFQITAWNAQRADNERAALIHLRLERDFEQLVRSADSVHGAYEEIAEATTRAIDFIRSGADFPDDYTEAGFRSDLNRMMQGTSPVGRSPTYVELQSGGQMHLIRDEALREALSEFDEMQRQTAELYRIFVDMQLRYGEAVIPAISFHDEMAPGSAGPGSTVVAYDLDRLRTEPGIVPALTMIRRAHFYNMLWQGSLAQRARDVRRMLDDEPGQGRQSSPEGRDSQ